MSTYTCQNRTEQNSESNGISNMVPKYVTQNHYIHLFIQIMLRLLDV